MNTCKTSTTPVDPRFMAGPRLCGFTNNPDNRRGRCIAPSADLSALGGSIVPCCLCLMILTLLAACSPGISPNTPQTPPTPVPVNGFGSASNHVHSLIALPHHVLVLATHYGLFRSADNGATWQEVAGGNNQLMQGLMTYSLVVSPLDSQRLYVLTQPNVIPHRGTLGLYTSADQGRTWQLAVAAASITSGSIFMAAPGNDTPAEVYIYLRDLGALGLRVSLDAGQHFSSAGTLPFASILGLLAIPGAPGHLLAYGSDGMARSTDGGNHWQVLSTITGGINQVTTPGPRGPIYASGDAGIYVSLDSGKTFKLVENQVSYASLTVSPQQPQVIYGKTGLAVYRSDNGGRTWDPLPHIQGNLAVLAADPSNALGVYLSLSYPTALYRLDQGGKDWLSLTPQA
jgi:photosystem II stability/assembly factor-like uncharacterized protein